MEAIKLIIASKTFTAQTEILDPTYCHNRDLIVFTNSWKFFSNKTAMWRQMPSSHGGFIAKNFSRISKNN